MELSQVLQVARVCRVLLEEKGFLELVKLQSYTARAQAWEVHMQQNLPGAGWSANCASISFWREIIDQHHCCQKQHVNSRDNQETRALG